MKGNEIQCSIVWRHALVLTQKLERGVKQGRAAESERDEEEKRAQNAHRSPGLAAVARRRRERCGAFASFVLADAFAFRPFALPSPFS